MKRLVAVASSPSRRSPSRRSRRRIRSATSPSTATRGSRSPGASSTSDTPLDLAEIPTYQLGGEVRKPGYAARLARDLSSPSTDAACRCASLSGASSPRPGAGGLQTLRLDVIYAAGSAGRRSRFRDRSFDGRIGWREITVSARDGAAS